SEGKLIERFGVQGSGFWVRLAESGQSLRRSSASRPVRSRGSACRNRNHAWPEPSPEMRRSVSSARSTTASNQDRDSVVRSCRAAQHMTCRPGTRSKNPEKTDFEPRANREPEPRTQNLEPRTKNPEPRANREP